jgi:DNA-binding Lrp family transcriptional regulator
MTKEEEVLRLIMSKEEGILQSDVWKKTEIDARKCSRIVSNLEKKGLIRREWEKLNGTRTYRIFYIGKYGKYDLLMADSVLAPCIGCSEECAPVDCARIERWTHLLAKESSEHNI